LRCIEEDYLGVEGGVEFEDRVVDKEESVDDVREVESGGVGEDGDADGRCEEVTELDGGGDDIQEVWV
jgi:hypothetical protein